METYLEQALQSEITSKECKLCCVNLSTPSVTKQHCASKRHKDNVAKYLETVKQEFLLSCVNQKNIQGNRQGNEDLYCKTCCIQTATKEQMWNHLKKTTHQLKAVELGHPQINGSTAPFNANLPKKLKDQMLVDICHICNNSFSTVSRALEHYGSSKHDVAVRRWFREKRQNEKSDRNSVAKPEPNDIKQEPKTTERFYCYPCRIYVDSKLEKNKHVQNFPHLLLVKLKSALLKEGIAEEYWSIRGSEVNCLLCDRLMSDSLGMTTHINSVRHRETYNNWCKNLPPRKVTVDVRWYYCKICDKDLDGTNESERHYSSPSHSKKSQLYCYICKVSNATPELLDAHKSSSLHMEMLQKSQKPIAVCEQGTEGTGRCALFIKSNDSGTNKTEQNPEALNSEPSSTTKQCKEKSNIITNLNPLGKYNETVSMQEVLKNTLLPTVGHYRLDTNITSNSESIEKSSTTSSTSTLNRSERNSNIYDDSKFSDINISNNAEKLKEQVFNELELLVQKLYYSKTVPYGVALDYLKRMNREVDKLSKKHSTENMAYVSKQHTYELHQTTYTNNYMHRKEPSLVLEEIYDYTEGAKKEFIGNDTKKDNLQPGGLKLLDTTTSKIVLNLDQPDTVNFISESEELPQNRSFSFDNDSILGDTDEKMGTPETHNSAAKIDTENGEDKKARNISDLIRNVIERKRDIEQHSEHSLEKEVLNEMEIFLRQIEDSEVPLEEILRYLESVNEELQTKEFYESVEIPDEELQTKEFDEPVEIPNEELQMKEFGEPVEIRNEELQDKEVDEPLEIPYEEKEKGEKSGQEGPKYSDELLTVRTCENVDRQLGVVVEDTSLAYLHFMDFRECSIDLYYNYYSSKNFILFSKFLEAYLQRSPDDWLSMKY